MPPHLHRTETEDRGVAMLRSAFCGPIREALDAPDTIEIMANPDGAIWVERAGQDVRRSDAVLGAAERERVIRLVASASGESVQRGSPIVSAELPGTGERFEGLLPPVAAAPCFSIRKPGSSPFSLGDYVDQGALDYELCEALREAVEARANIVIAGGTSSGKTTFANALLRESAFERDRLVILEDTRELSCAAPNLVQLRTRRGAVSLQALVHSTMRLRPDRIIIGEVRGPEALDLLKAWNTGHPGGLTTLHANSAQGALARLEQLTLEATARPVPALIADAVDIIVFMSRPGGKRRIEDAIRVLGHAEGGYLTQPLSHPVPAKEVSNDRL